MRRALQAQALALLLFSPVASARAGEGPVCVGPPAGLVSWWPGESGAEDVQGTMLRFTLNGAAGGADLHGSSGVAVSGLSQPAKPST
jgi:hypothetical protein